MYCNNICCCFCLEPYLLELNSTGAPCLVISGLLNRIYNWIHEFELFNHNFYSVGTSGVEELYCIIFVIEKFLVIPLHCRLGSHDILLGVTHDL